MKTCIWNKISGNVQTTIQKRIHTDIDVDIDTDTDIDITTGIDI